MAMNALYGDIVTAVAALVAGDKTTAITGTDLQTLLSSKHDCVISVDQVQAVHGTTAASLTDAGTSTIPSATSCINGNTMKHRQRS